MKREPAICLLLCRSRLTSALTRERCTCAGIIVTLYVVCRTNTTTREKCCESPIPKVISSVGAGLVATVAAVTIVMKSSSINHLQWQCLFLSLVGAALDRFLLVSSACSRAAYPIALWQSAAIFAIGPCYYIYKCNIFYYLMCVFFCCFVVKREQMMAHKIYNKT